MILDKTEMRCQHDSDLNYFFPNTSHGGHEFLFFFLGLVPQNRCRWIE